MIKNIYINQRERALNKIKAENTPSVFTGTTAPQTE
jgi:hypothetical protein